MPGTSRSSSTRNPTSCSVPIVNALRRYAGPRKCASSLNQAPSGRGADTAADYGRHRRRGLDYLASAHVGPVVVRASDAAGLPTQTDGSVDEEGIDEADAIGEIEDIESNAKKSVTFDLEPGEYVFFCNVVQRRLGPTCQPLREAA